MLLTIDLLIKKLIIHYRRKRQIAPITVIFTKTKNSENNEEFA
ncbi:hypothetical protein AOT82_2783 [Psychrobacter sp. AntiMn-1]|nr:hypothetical protein AOT82_2783 [Psychrobacter sp. AntiMn-1]